MQLKRDARDGWLTNEDNESHITKRRDLLRLISRISSHVFSSFPLHLFDHSSLQTILMRRFIYQSRVCALPLGLRPLPPQPKHKRVDMRSPPCLIALKCLYQVESLCIRKTTLSLLIFFNLSKYVNIFVAKFKYKNSRCWNEHFTSS